MDVVRRRIKALLSNATLNFITAMEIVQKHDLFEDKELAAWMDEFDSKIEDKLEKITRSQQQKNRQK